MAASPRANGARGTGSVHPAELAVIPGDPAPLDELEGNPLLGLLRHGRSDLVGDLAVGAAGVAPEDIEAEVEHGLEVTVEHNVRLDHHAAQEVVFGPRLNLERRARVAF